MIRRSKRTRNFTVLSNELIADKQIDWRDLGLLVYLLSKPDDWEVSVTHLADYRKAGKDAIRVSLKALQKAGYAKWERKSDGTTEWLIVDDKNILSVASDASRGVAAQPDTENPDQGFEPETDNPDQGIENPQPEMPHVENPTQVNTDQTEEQRTDTRRESDIAAEWLANYLSKNIKSFNETAKTKPEKWIDDIEKLIRIDQRPPREVKAIVDWIYRGAGDWWKPIILSGKKLRIQYDTIKGQMIRSHENADNENSNKTSGREDPFWQGMRERNERRQQQIDDR